MDIDSNTAFTPVEQAQIVIIV
jgi:hypothetical protein